MLFKACCLDKDNLDAIRMCYALEATSPRQYLNFLIEHEYLAQKQFNKIVRQAKLLTSIPQHNSILLAVRPVLCWYTAITIQALKTGHYMYALSYGKRILEYDSDDVTDIHFTMLNATVMFEYSFEDLLLFAQKYCSINSSHLNAWIGIALIASTYKCLDFNLAEKYLSSLFFFLSDSNKSISNSRRITGCLWSVLMYAHLAKMN